MRQNFEVPDYADLKREVDALRKKLEEMESGGIRPKIAVRTKRWGWLSRKSTSLFAAVFCVVLLTVVGLGAQNKLTAFFIDDSGKVGINQMKPEQTLDVNGNALVRGSITTDSLTVKNDATFGQQLPDGDKPTKPFGTTTVNNALNFGNSDLYFTKTDHNHIGKGNTLGWAAIENGSNYKSLMILGRMLENADKTNIRDITMWDRVAIRKTDPQSALDVQGEVRGKPWYSQTFEWTQGQPPVKMTRVDRTVCFLTLVSGQLYGGGEAVQIEEGPGTGEDKKWILTGKSATRDVRAQARCIGVPDNEKW